MAKYYGVIGYAEVVDKGLGVWEEEIVERPYHGDVLSVSKRWEGADKLNDNINISNRLSIVADPYAYQHFHSIRYVEWYGTKWLVNTVEVKPPRLVLSIGGVYNGETPTTTPGTP